MKTATGGKKKTAKEGGGNTGRPAPTAGQKAGKWALKAVVRRNDELGMSLHFHTKVHPTTGEARCRLVKRNIDKEIVGSTAWAIFKTEAAAAKWIEGRMEEAAAVGYVKKYRSGSTETVEVEDLLQ